MAGRDTELARLLQGLKRRSRRSYDELARRALVSRSALHRYCTGKGVPADAETILRIARACDATPDDTNQLLDAWLIARRGEAPEPAETEAAPEPDPASATGTATGARPVAGAEAAPEPDAAGPRPAPAAPAPDPGPAADPAPPPPAVRAPAPPAPRVPAPRASRRVPVAVTVVILLVLLVAGLAGSGVPPKRSARVSQWVSGPAWSIHPKPVDPAMFGVTINSDTGQMPSFRVGSARLWDSGTRWSSIQPHRGTYRWSTLERLVSGARENHLATLFVIGGTPGWAAPNAPHTAYPDDSRAAAPDHLADWDAFISRLVHRFSGRIESYELWDMANDPRYYTGRLETLVQMTRRASEIIRAADPRAHIVCPGITDLWRRQSMATLRRFAALGGYGYCDAVSVKLHKSAAGDPPESVLPLLAMVEKELHEAGVGLPIWNTGVTYDAPYDAQLASDRAPGYATRFYLTTIYGRIHGLRRAYFYNWGSPRVPVVLQAVGGPPTAAARAVDRLQRWLDRARIRSCGQGAQLGLARNVWECAFVIDGRPAVIRWTHTGTADTVPPKGTDTVHRLDGSQRRLRAGDTVRVTGDPIMLTGAA